MASEVYERIRAAIGDEHGLSDVELERHVRAIVLLVLERKGLL